MKKSYSIVILCSCSRFCWSFVFLLINWWIFSKTFNFWFLLFGIFFVIPSLISFFIFKWFHTFFRLQRSLFLLKIELIAILWSWWWCLIFMNIFMKVVRMRYLLWLFIRWKRWIRKNIFLFILRNNYLFLRLIFPPLNLLHICKVSVFCLKINFKSFDSLLNLINSTQLFWLRWWFITFFNSFLVSSYSDSLFLIFTFFLLRKRRNIRFWRLLIFLRSNMRTRFSRIWCNFECIFLRRKVRLTTWVIKE